MQQTFAFLQPTPLEHLWTFQDCSEAWKQHISWLENWFAQFINNTPLYLRHIPTPEKRQTTTTTPIHNSNYTHIRKKNGKGNSVAPFLHHPHSVSISHYSRRWRSKRIWGGGLSEMGNTGVKRRNKKIDSEKDTSKLEQDRGVPHLLIFRLASLHPEPLEDNTMHANLRLITIHGSLGVEWEQENKRGRQRR